VHSNGFNQLNILPLSDIRCAERRRKRLNLGWSRAARWSRLEGHLRPNPLAGPRAGHVTGRTVWVLASDRSSKAPISADTSNCSSISYSEGPAEKKGWSNYTRLCPAMSRCLLLLAWRPRHAATLASSRRRQQLSRAAGLRPRRKL